MVAGEAALGAVVKDAKEQLRALPDGLTYGLLRYLNPEVELDGSDPVIGFNYLGRLGAAAAELSDELWRISQDGLSLTGAAAAIPMPLAHTVELNAATADTDAGPQLHANWTWAPSALDHAQVDRLSRLWFEALAGICAHVRAGGGGLTPSDIAPARLSQQQIDELCQQYRIADVLPLTPLQQGLLFHASTAQGSGDDVYAVQLDITITGALDAAPAARGGAHGGQPASQPGRPDSATSSTSRCRSSRPIPWRRGGMSNWTPATADVDEQVRQVCAAERAAVCDLAAQPAFRAALIRTARGPAPVCADQSPHRDGWLVAADPAAGNIRRLLRAAAARGRCRTADLSPGWPIGTCDAARAAWGEVLAGFDTPTLVGPPGRLGLGPRGVASFRVSEQTTRALGELARSRHTTVNTVLQAAWAQLLMWLTGQHDVAFGTAVSGRPAELAGAESMVGLLINTVPVRANITAATTIADLLDQLQSAHNHTLEHQHLALSEIHRVTGHDQLFDTFSSYENYPIDTAALSGVDELAITEFTTREYNHYPLSVQAVPGHELGLRVEFDTEVFDAASIEALIERLQRVLVAMTADSGEQS